MLIFEFVFPRILVILAAILNFAFEPNVEIASQADSNFKNA